MPHIVVEYSSNLEKEVKKSSLLKLAHKTVIDSGLFDPQAVKARGIGYDDYVLPEGASSFLHVTISILSGRTISDKKSLSEAVFQNIISAIPAIDKLSVDIHDMDVDSYKK